MAQTAYSVNPAIGYRGLLADPNVDAFAIPLANGAAAAQGFGLMVMRDAVNPGDQFDIFSATGQTPLGVLVHTHEQQDPTLAGDLGIALLEMASVLRRGRIWVRVEEAVAPGEDVYYRHTTGTGTEIGAFRNDADGTAQVTTLTPTVVDDTRYSLNIIIAGVLSTYSFLSGAAGNVQITTCTPTVVEDDLYALDVDVSGVPYHFEAIADGSAGAAQVTTLTPTVTNSVVYGLQVLVQGHLYRYNFTSDGSAADTEIVTGLRALIDADLVFSALVVSTGTTTIILTGQVAGMRFDVVEAGDGTEAGVMTSITETTPPGVATATTLCNKFRALMAADAAFTAAIVATGTTTLVLTGQTAGEGYKVASGALGAWASLTETQAAAVATATQICDGFRALMAADAAFTALCVATGTTTLILTSQNEGQVMDVNNGGAPGVMVIVPTIAPASTCDLIANAQWLQGSAAAGVALLEINVP